VRAAGTSALGCAGGGGGGGAGALLVPLPGGCPSRSVGGVAPSSDAGILRMHQGPPALPLPHCPTGSQQLGPVTCCSGATTF
jgi:hypothetical protein